MTKPKTTNKKLNTSQPGKTDKRPAQTSAARLSVVPLATVINDPHNVNKHTEKGTRLVAESIEAHGMARPGFAAYNKAGELVMLGGNLSSLEVPATMGLDEAVLVFTDGKRPIIHVRQDLDADSDAARLLALRDNVAGVASYDPDIAELAALSELEGFDRIISDKEYKKLIAGALMAEGDDDEPAEPGPTDQYANAMANEWGTLPGQVWAMGAHRLMVGDSTVPEDVARLLMGEGPDAVVTDPPYGINLDTDYSSMPAPARMKISKGIKGGKKWDKIKGDAGPFDPATLFTLWAAPEMFLFGADYYADAIPGRLAGSWLVWDKRLEESADLMYGSGFELCWSKKPHKRDLIRVKWAGVFGTEKEDTKARVHPSHKPTLLFKWIIERHTKPGQIVADPYSGAGSSLIACQQTGRAARCMEIDAGYAAVTLQRYADITGESPVKVHDAE